MRSKRFLPLLACSIFVVQPLLTQIGFSQTSRADYGSAVSSDAFLNGLRPTSLVPDVITTGFPDVAMQGGKTVGKGHAIPVGYAAEYAESRSESVSTAQFQSPASTNPIGSGSIGSGVSNQSPPTSDATTSALAPSAIVQSSSRSDEATRLGWRERLGLDRNQPNFQVGYEVLGFRRSNDSVGPYTQAQELRRFDQEVSARYTFSRLLGGTERIEFKFAGPFHWDKLSSTLGPVDSNFPSLLASSFDQSDIHRQSHHIRLSSYELNRCWSSDELSNFYYGLRVIDHAEGFRLDASKGIDNSSFQLSANNLLAGGQIGLSLFRPISQRLSVGIDGGLGLYGNFARGSLRAVQGSTTLLDTSDSRLRITSMFTTGGRVNYRLSQNVAANAGYEYWYFPGLATAADQQLSSNAQLTALALRTGDDQLFRGWAFGLSARF